MRAIDKAAGGLRRLPERVPSRGAGPGRMFDASRFAPTDTPFSPLGRVPYLDVTRLGVAKGSEADQDGAIASALAICLAAGCAAYFPGQTGRYCHAAPILPAVPLIGDVGATVIHGTATGAIPTGAIHFSGVADCFVYGLIKTHEPNPRSAMTLAAGLVLTDTDRFWLAASEVRGTPGAGVFVSGAHRAAFEDLIASDTMADGFHVRPSAARGSATISVSRFQALRTGDDGLAVVSYLTDSFTSAGVFVRDIRVRDQQTAGRGIALAGVTDALVDGFEIDGTVNAGLLLGSDGGNATRGSHRVTVRNGSLRNVGGGPSLHAAMHFRFASGDAVCSGIAVEDVRVASARRHLAFVSSGSPANASALALRRVSGSTSGTFDAMELGGCDGITVADCHLEASGKSGLIVRADADNVTVGGLSARNLNASATASADLVNFAAAGTAKACTLGEIRLDGQDGVLERLVEVGANWTPSFSPGTSRTARVKSGVNASTAGYTDPAYTKRTY